MATIERTVDVPHGYEVVKSWRIIDTDNFGGDYPNEKFIAVGIKEEWRALQMADDMNDRSGADGLRFYRAVEHIEIVYKLVPGFEP